MTTRFSGLAHNQLDTNISAFFFNSITKVFLQKVVLALNTFSYVCTSHYIMATVKRYCKAIFPFALYHMDVAYIRMGGVVVINKRHKVLPIIVVVVVLTFSEVKDHNVLNLITRLTGLLLQIEVPY